MGSGALTLAPVHQKEGGGFGRFGWGVSVRPAQILSVALFFMLGANIVRVPLLDAQRSQAPLGINDLAVLVVLAVSGIVMLRARSMKLDVVAMAAMLFIAIGGLSAVAGVSRFSLSAHELAVSLAYLARWATYFGIYLAVINCVRREDIPSLWTAMERTILIFAAFGIIQSLFLPNFFELFREEGRAYVDYDPQGHRLVSTVLEPNVAAAMIMVVLVVQIALISCGARVAYWKPLLLMTALVLTVSRSGALGLFVGGLLVLSARGMTKRLLRFATPVLVLVLAFLPRIIELLAAYGKAGLSDNSALARLVAWGRAFAVFLEHPWFGIGFNTYAFVQQRRGFEVMNNSSYSVEGGLLFVAVMTGIVGLAAYCLMIGLVWKRCRRIWRDVGQSPEVRGLAIGAVAATVGVMVHSLFVNSLLVPFIMEMLWILWGFAFLMRPRPPQRMPEYQVMTLQ